MGFYSKKVRSRELLRGGFVRFRCTWYNLFSAFGLRLLRIHIQLCSARAVRPFQVWRSWDFGEVLKASLCVWLNLSKDASQLQTTSCRHLS